MCTTKRLSHEVTKASRGTHPIKPWTSWVMIGYMSSLRPVPTIRVCSSPLLVGSYLVVIYVSFTCHWDLNRPRHPHLSSFCACACVEIHNRLVTPRHATSRHSQAEPAPALGQVGASFQSNPDRQNQPLAQANPWMLEGSFLPSFRRTWEWKLVLGAAA